MPYQITARTADMSTRYIPYFTTALHIGTAAFLLSHASAWAQTTDVVQPMCASYGLNTLPSPHVTGDLPWWFLSNEKGSSKNDFFTATLPILAADKHALWGADSRILTQMKPEAVTPSVGAVAAFYILREHIIKPAAYAGAAGRFVEVIGMARRSVSSQSIVVDGVSTVPLIIRTARDEVDANDRLLPVECMVADANPVPLSSAPLDPAKAARIKILLNDVHIGERKAIALIDQGQDRGVAVGQVWQLVDELPHQPASAQAFGRARVLQVFEHSSVVHVDRADHELEVGTLLRFLPEERMPQKAAGGVQP